MSENNDVSVCPMTCHECFLLGDSVPDWPQRILCNNLSKLQDHLWDDDGGTCASEETAACAPICQRLALCGGETSACAVSAHS